MEKENEIIELLKQMNQCILELKTDVNCLKEGQNNVLELLQHIDLKQAKNHLEMLNEFKDVRREMSRVVENTAENWIEIAKLKIAK
jgi:hypothetical protein